MKFGISKTHTHIVFISLVTKLALGGFVLLPVYAVQAQTNPVTDSNAFDEKTFRLDLEAYLGPEGTKEFKELYSDHKRKFQNQFTNILRALGKKTIVNGERIESTKVVQPLIRTFVSTLRSFQFEGTQPGEKYQELVKEQNRLLFLGVSLPTSFTESVKIMQEPAMLGEKIIVTCDKNGNYMIDRGSKDERICAANETVKFQKEGYEQEKRGYEQEKRGYEQEKRGYEQEKRGYEQATQREEQAKRRLEQAKRRLEQEKRGYEQATQREEQARRSLNQQVQRMIDNAQ